LRAAHEGGLIFKSKDLCIDVASQLSELSVASAKAFSFAIEIGYVTPETIGPMLQKAQTKARALVLEGGIPVPSMMEFVLAKAAANAKAIHSLASGEASPVASAAAPAVSAKEEKEEKKEEGDTAAGLGALFG
jgi:large subunit ribosomal protein L10